MALSDRKILLRFVSYVRYVRYFKKRSRLLGLDLFCNCKSAGMFRLFLQSLSTFGGWNLRNFLRTSYDHKEPYLQKASVHYLAIMFSFQNYDSKKFVSSLMNTNFPQLVLCPQCGGFRAFPLHFIRRKNLRTSPFSFLYSILSFLFF
jgi:hypothetical protein